MPWNLNEYFPASYWNRFFHHFFIYLFIYLYIFYFFSPLFLANQDLLLAQTVAGSLYENKQL